MDALYFYDALSAETLYLEGGSNGCHLAPDGFLPSSSASETIRVTVARALPADIDVPLGLLRLWLDRAAARYAAGNGFIYLYYLPAGRAFTRRAVVQGGTARKADWSYSARTGVNYFLSGLEVQLQHDPPELSERFTLKNLVANPSFEYDTDGDGTPNDWTLAGAATPVLETAVLAHGRYSVSLTTPTPANDYLQSANITVTVGAVYEVTMQALGATIDVGCQLTVHRSDTGAVLATLTHSGNILPLTRKRATFTAPTATCYIRLQDVNGTGFKAYFDCLYLGRRNTYGGADYDHGMWSDYNALNDHDDWEWNNAGGAPYGAGANQNSTHREIIDVLAIPGDRAPLVQVQVEGAIDFDAPLVAALSRYQASTTFLSLQAESGTLAGGAALDTDAGASGPAADNCVRLPLAIAGAAYVSWTITEAAALRLAGKLVRVVAWLANRANPGGAEVVQWGLSHDSAVAPTDYYDITLGNYANRRWLRSPGPTFRFPLRAPMRPAGYAPYSDTLYFWARQAGGGDCFFDRIILMAVDGYIEGPAAMFLGGAGVQHLLVDDDAMYDIDTPTDQVVIHYPARGRLSNYTLENELRLWINLLDGPRVATPGVASNVTLYVRPRYATL